MLIYIRIQLRIASGFYCVPIDDIKDIIKSLPSLVNLPFCLAIHRMILCFVNSRTCFQLLQKKKTKFTAGGETGCRPSLIASHIVAGKKCSHSYILYVHVSAFN